VLVAASPLVLAWVSVVRTVRLLTSGSVTVASWTTAALLLSGCAAIFAPRPQAIPVRSVPAGAEVFVDGVGMGTTPITLELDARRPYEVLLVLDGAERVIVLESGVDGTYVALDVLPGVGLAAATLALALTCSDVIQCTFLAIIAPTGVTAGLAWAAVATAADAATGSWKRLSPGEVVVIFDGADAP
jgi:hypothetical protein